MKHIQIDFGIPTPVRVPQNKVEGKAILVSGHDLEFFEKLLIATEDKGINVYTHSEMLPAHGYPELRKFKHLKGNVGKAWFDQAKLMEKFTGTFVVNTNCIVPPKKIVHILIEYLHIKLLESKVQLLLRIMILLINRKNFSL